MWGTKSGDFREGCGQIRLVGSEPSGISGFSEHPWYSVATSTPCAYDWSLLTIQRLLIMALCHKFPSACEQLSIPWPSLRTPRCVGIGILICACIKSLSWYNLSNWSFEYLRASWRNRTVHRWRTCGNRTDQGHRRRPGFHHNPVFFFLFLHPSRHPVGAADQAEIFRHSRERAEMADVEQWRRLFHSSRVKCPFVNVSAIWCLVSMYLIWILGSKLFLSNNQSRATLWVLDTCQIVGLLHLIIILITASLSSNTYNKALDREHFVFEGTLSTWNKSELSCAGWALVWFFLRVLDVTRCHKFPCANESLALSGWPWL